MATEEKRKVRVGMVGGGLGAGIAETHRTAMRLDDNYLIVAGVFSRDPEKSLTAAKKLQIPTDRVYPDYVAMAEAESRRDENRIDAVVGRASDSGTRKDSLKPLPICIQKSQMLFWPRRTEKHTQKLSSVFRTQRTG